jgi:group I intron endonuclease
MGFIYEITCVPTGKRYVGQTCKKKVEYRWTDHVYYAVKRNGKTKLANAIRKYGAQAFQCKILECCDDLDQREIYWIKTLGTINELNISAGGNASTRGMKRSPEVMKNCLLAAHKANKGRVQTEEEKNRRSKSMQGKPKSLEHRQNLSKARIRWLKSTGQ